MTTAIYKEEHFAACDSLWTNDGGLVRRDITEKKGITFNFKDSELVSFMAGNHVAIALMQAMQLSVITNEHYANLMTLYMEHTDMQMSMVGVRLENGIYGHSRFCNTDFDDKLACLNLSGV